MKTFILSSIIIFVSLCTTAQYRKCKSDFREKTILTLQQIFISLQKLLLGLFCQVQAIFTHKNICVACYFRQEWLLPEFWWLPVLLENWADGWDSNPHDGGKGKMIIGEIAFVGIYILNFIDAVRIAKIKNLYLREQSVALSIKPYLKINEKVKSTGLNLQIAF